MTEQRISTSTKIDQPTLDELMQLARSRAQAELAQAARSRTPPPVNKYADEELAGMEERDALSPAAPHTAVVAQVGGTHYSKSSGLCPACGQEVQHWDVYADQPYLEGAATSYIGRWRDKGGLEDLRKAISFLEKRLRLEELKERLRLLGKR